MPNHTTFRGRPLGGTLLLCLAPLVTEAQVTVSSLTEFALVKPGQPAVVRLEVRNALSEPVTLLGISFDSPVFALADTLPKGLGARGAVVLSLAAHPTFTALHLAHCTLGIASQGAQGTAVGSFRVGLILDDGSEAGENGRRALDAYTAARESGVGGRSQAAAVANNRGVLYRLLGETAEANTEFTRASQEASSGRLGTAGIRMNLGVVASDRGETANAQGHYASALSQIGSVKKGLVSSSLAPQLYFNQAWEAYTQGNLSGARTLADTVLAHKRSSRLLKAKAYVLRAGLAAAEGNPAAARKDLDKAVASDPQGPIGQLARDNLLVITPGQFRFREAGVVAREVDGQARLVVSRIQGDGGPVSVSWQTTKGSATLGADYTAQSGELHWSDGDARDQVLAVTFADDALVEGDETIGVRLVGPTGGASLGKPASATVTIAGTGTVRFREAKTTVAEASGQAVIVVSRVGGDAEAISVTFRTGKGSAVAGTDYVAQSTVLTWADGDATDRMVEVPLIHDAIAEKDETVRLELKSPSPGLKLGKPNVATLFITDRPVSSSSPEAAATAAARSASIRLSPLQRGVEGRFILPLEVAAGRRYRLESSADLRTWIEAARFVGESGPMEFEVALPPGVSQAFFRVVEEADDDLR